MKRSLIRDFIVYFISSSQSLLFKGEFVYFVKDILSFPQWRKYSISSQSILEHRIPWMAFGVIRFLDRWLKKDMVVHEYGSGGSTLFISDRVHQIYSIEHNAEWFEVVKSVIQKEGIRNIEYRLYSPVVELSDSHKDCSDPGNYLSCMGEFKDLNFESYVRSIDEFPDNHFDFIIVDGRARPSCIKHSIKKIRRDGILLVDNADRSYYLESFPELFDDIKWKHSAIRGHTPYGLTSVVYTTMLFTKK